MSASGTVAETNGDGSRHLPAERAESGERAGLVLSDAVADQVGALLTSSEEAAKAITYKAQADADLIVRTATQDAAREARSAVVAIASEAVPRLELRVSELHALVDRVRGELERLTEDLSRLAGGEPPRAMLSAPPAAAEPSLPSPPPPRTQEERRALLIALNMANNGASRDEAEKYLVDNLSVDDPQALLDAVFGTAG
jgi:hypothetical protein